MTEYYDAPRNFNDAPCLDWWACWLAPVEIRPHVCAALAAGLAHEPRLDIGQPGIIGPAVAADGDRVAAAVVGAVHE